MTRDPILLDIPERLVGDRVVVRAYRPGDGQALFEAVDESREHILPWMPWGPSHDSPEASETVCRKFIARWTLREDLGMSIWDHDETTYLGGTGLHRIDWHSRVFEIGYWIRKSAHGKGHVSEAVVLLSQLAFEHLDANRVHIRCATENLRSRAIPERLGFRREGVQRQALVDANGDVHDLEVYSLVRGEYAVLKSDWGRRAT